MRSAFDANWIRNAPHRNPFYVALPYNDVDNHHTKPEAVSIIPWFKQAFVRDGQSVCKDRWVAIRKGNRVAYAQWEDVGPFQTDHWQYVFGSESRDSTITPAPRPTTIPRPATAWPRSAASPPRPKVTTPPVTRSGTARTLNCCATKK
jgi:hypothetical protein